VRHRNAGGDRPRLGEVTGTDLRGDFPVLVGALADVIDIELDRVIEFRAELGKQRGDAVHRAARLADDVAGVLDAAIRGDRHLRRGEDEAPRPYRLAAGGGMVIGGPHRHGRMVPIDASGGREFYTGQDIGQRHPRHRHQRDHRRRWHCEFGQHLAFDGFRGLRHLRHEVDHDLDDLVPAPARGGQRFACVPGTGRDLRGQIARMLDPTVGIDIDLTADDDEFAAGAGSAEGGMARPGAVSGSWDACRHVNIIIL